MTPRQIIAVALIACHRPAPEADTAYCWQAGKTCDSHGDTGKNPPEFSCSGEPADYLVWGQVGGGAEGVTCDYYTVPEIAERFPPEGAACDTAWVNHGSYAVAGDVVADFCLVDEDLGAWCRANVPCWTGTECPTLAEFISHIGVTDPASTYDWGHESTAEHSYFGFPLALCHDPTGAQEASFAVQGGDFEEREWSFRADPGTDVDDAALVEMLVYP